MREAVTDFIDYLTYVRKYSENTLAGYERDLCDFADYLTAKKYNYKELDYSKVTEYLVHLNNLGLKSSSISRHLSSIRSFYDYLLKNNKLSHK